MLLKGAFTAMITPFIHDMLDEEGLIKNIRYQLSSKISGLVFLGTTGEAATLTDCEQRKVIEIGVEHTKGKALVIVGTGSYSTKLAIEKTQRAKDLGADAALVVTPYYNKPSQEGIFRHFEAIAKSVDLPLIVYNIQGRTGVNIETSTLLKIAELPNVIGVKESSGNLGQAGDVIYTIARKYPHFSVLSGDDAATLPMMALGAVGAVSVVSNLVPQKISSLVQMGLVGNFGEMRKLHEELLPLFKDAFVEVNPVPIKEAMNLCSLPAGPCRLPLCELKPENREKIRKLLSFMQLLPQQAHSYF